MGSMTTHEIVSAMPPAPPLLRPLAKVIHNNLGTMSIVSAIATIQKTADTQHF